METGKHTYDISGLGNLTYKKADGTVLFAEAVYGGNDAGPHALSSATTSPGIFPPAQQDIVYNAFDKVTSITEGDKSLQITYGHHRQRIRQQYTAAGSATTKVYVGACEYITKNGQTTIHTYLSGPEGLFAVVVKEPKGLYNIQYIHTDHLGSWNTISDAAGNRLQEINFDAWGNRRDPNTWRAFASTPPQPLFDRGFTGHEHLFGFQLINMNGRVYDPVVSRMLSPDNFVQAPDFSQSFNRYSYCVNNPLRYNDPSGEIFMAPFFAMAMVADFTSNLINGHHDPLGTAYKNVSSTISGINNAVRVPVYQSQNTNISIGLNPFSFGVSINASFRSGDVIQSFNGGFGFFGADFGATTTINTGDFTFSFGGGYNSGWTNLMQSKVKPQYISGFQVFGGASYFDRNRNQRFSFGLSSFYGSHPQKNWFVGYGRGDFSFAMTNDAFRGSDWYRTAAAEIGIGEVSFGFNLFTTEPPLEEYKSKPHKGENSEYISPIHGKNPLGTYSTGSRVYAGMYLGYRNGNRISRFGVDAPWVQDLFQNGIHRWVVPTPYFNTNYGSPSAPFLQGGYVNPFSLYTF